MGEKKFVFTNLRVSYNGAIDVEEFFADIDKWLKQHDYEKNPKKYSERLTKNGKQISWVIEAHKEFGKWFKGTLLLKVLFDNLKESVTKISGKRRKIMSADVLVQLDGIIESHLSESFYHDKPLYQFFVLMVDKYIYNFWSDKYDGNVVSDGNALFKHIRSFFSLQKYKFQEAS